MSTNRRLNFSVDVDPKDLRIDDSLNSSFHQNPSRNFQTVAIPRYMRYSELKDHQGTDAVKQLSFKSPKQIREIHR